jgi:glycosyltransferase involved in cell wall biosynthesis
MGLGLEMNIITWAFQNSRHLAERIDGVNVTRLRGLNLRLLPSITEYPYLIGLRETLGRLNPDIIDCQSHLFLPTLQAIRAAKSRRIPTVVTVRGLLAKRGLVTELSQWAYLRTVCRKYMNRASCVICLTDSDRSLVQSLRMAERVEVVPNGVDLMKFRPDPRKDPHCLAWAGRMVPEKGLESLLIALSDVVKEIPDVTLQLVGDGPLMPTLQTLAARLGVSSNCVFLGRRTREEVASILSKSSVFVLPSLSEGLPKAMLEAMGCGNAIVASDLPQIRDIIGGQGVGFLNDPRDTHGLAESLLACLRDEDFTRRLESGSRRLAEDRYDLRTILLRRKQLYQRLVEQPR